MILHGSCSACGADLPPGATACPTCGAAAAGRPSVAQTAGKRPWRFPASALADHLATAGLVDAETARALADEASTGRKSFVGLLVKKKHVEPGALRDAVAKAFDLPVATLPPKSIEPSVLAAFPAEVAREHIFLPLACEGTRLVLAISDPTLEEPLRAVRAAVALTLDLRLATVDDLEPLVLEYFAPTVVALLPSGETLTIPMRSNELSIGKGSTNDLVLPGLDVSRMHALIRATDDGYQIVDFKSRNGVVVDGVRVEGSATLKHGDVIKIGECLLTFKLSFAAAEAAGDATRVAPPKPLSTSPSLAAVAKSSGPAAAAVAVAGAVAPELPKKDKKDKKKGEESSAKKGAKPVPKDGEKLKAAWIGFVGRLASQIVGALATVVLGLAVAGKLPTSCGNSSAPAAARPPTGANVVAPISFGELNTATSMEYNASGIVQVADSRFLIVENNTGDALFELDLTAEGAKTKALVRRPLEGLAPGTVDDIEGITSAEEGGRRYVFAASSMMTKVKHKVQETPPAGLLRISVKPDGGLAAENVPEFRTWFVHNCQDVGNADILEPDDGGLNVEGLAWDPTRHALLLGFRTPLHGASPIIVPIRVKDLAGPWDTSNLEVLPSVFLTLEQGAGGQGIRDIQYDPTRGTFLVLVGNDTSLSTSPFRLYTWDGNPEGTTHLVQGIWFAPKMKAEGIAHATLGGRGCVVITDDHGGYQVIWDDDPRLQ